MPFPPISFFNFHNWRTMKWSLRKLWIYLFAVLLFHLPSFFFELYWKSWLTVFRNYFFGCREFVPLDVNPVSAYSKTGKKKLKFSFIHACCWHNCLTEAKNIKACRWIFYTHNRLFYSAIRPADHEPVWSVISMSFCSRQVSFSPNFH